MNRKTEPSHDSRRNQFAKWLRWECRRMIRPATVASLGAMVSFGAAFAQETTPPAVPPASEAVQSPEAEGQPPVPAEADANPGEVATESTEAVVTQESEAPSPPLSEEWRKQLDQAKSSLQPDKLPKIDPARERLAQAIQRLETRLNRGSTDNAAKWLKFLRWDELKQALADPATQASTYAAAEIRFKQNYSGLELPEFVEVRNALHNLERAIRFGSAPDQSVQRLADFLKQLEDDLAKPRVGADLLRSREIGLVVTYLHESNQAPELAALLRSEYQHDNVDVQVSQKLIADLAGRPVDEYNPVCEEILGTEITGHSNLVGTVYPKLIPNAKAAQIQLQLTGKFSSQNVGLNRGVKLYSHGSADVHATGTLLVSDTGVQTMPVDVNVDLCTQVDSISHPLKIVRKIAAKQVSKKKSQAELIAEQRLHDRVANQFSEQIQEQVAESNGRFGPNGPPAFVRLGLAKPTIKYHTDSDKLSINLKQAEDHQLAAPNAPSFEPVEGELVVRSHQSALINVLDVVLGGRTIQSEELPDLLKQLLGKLPDDFKQQDDGPWSISLATYHPVEFDFHDQTIKVIVRLSRMSRGDQGLDQPLTVTATYRPEKVGEKVQLVRAGDVDITILGRQGRGTRAVALQTFLKRKFEKLFQERLLDKEPAENNGSILPAEMAARLKKVGPLKLSSLDLKDGWLQAALR